MSTITIYSLGTATFTNGSTALVGVGTVWTSLVDGDLVLGPDGKWYELTFTDNLNAVLDRPYEGGTAADTAYQIFCQSKARDSISSISSQLSTISGIFRTVFGLTSTDQVLTLNRLDDTHNAALYFDTAGENKMRFGLLGNGNFSIQFLEDATWKDVLTIDGVTGAVSYGSELAIDAPLDISDTTEASALGTAALVVAGGLSVAKKAIFGGALLAAAGTVALPGLAFAADPDTGIYSIGADNIGIGVGAVKQIDISSTKVAFTAATAATDKTSGAITIAGGLGVSGAAYFSTLFSDGLATLASLSVPGAAAVAGNLGVTGTLGVTGGTTLSTLHATAAVTFDNTLGVTGAVSFTAGLGVGGTLGVTGGTTLSTLHATGAVTFDSSLGVTGVATLASPVLTGNPTAPTQATADNSTKIANTAFTQAVVGAAATAAANAAVGAAVAGLPLGLKQITRFLSSGTYTKPSWLRMAIIKGCGGGGAGGGSGANATNSACGGGGGYAGYGELLLLAANISATETVTIGAGGTGNLNSGGSAGGNTSFGTHVTFNGGHGGSVGGAGVGTACQTSGGPGTGGTVGSGADLAITGASGEYGVRGLGAAFNQAFSGQGASGRMGAGGSSVTGSSAGGFDGNPGIGFGSGGSGSADGNSSTTHTGGAGAPGLVEVWEYD
jgi:hypothetical protein